MGERAKRHQSARRPSGPDAPGARPRIAVPLIGGAQRPRPGSHALFMTRTGSQEEPRRPTRKVANKGLPVPAERHPAPLQPAQPRAEPLSDLNSDLNRPESGARAI